MDVPKASGVDFTAHDLRRTFSTLFGEAGTDVYQIKAAMNHAAGQDVAERHYMRIRLKALRSVFERLEVPSVLASDSKDADSGKQKHCYDR